MERILEILTRRGYQSVGELAEELQVSEMTIRRYLERLEQRELVRRTHGGAYAGQDVIEADFRFRETVHAAEKEAIGRKAFSLIQPGESVFIDSGTTPSMLALAMTNTKRIIVVTNSLVVARALENKTNIQTILLGGSIDGITHSMTGPLAEQAIGRFRFKTAFLGASAIDLNEGFSQSSFQDLPAKLKAARQSQRVIVLADSSKLNRQVAFVFMKIGEAHAIITDNGIGDADRRALESKNIEVIVTDPASD